MPSPHSSIVDVLENLALSDPNKPAFIFVNETLDRLVLTRQQVWNYSRKFAAVLRKTGLNKGDVVCNTVPNSPLRLFSILGTITAGCITMSAQSCMADGSDLMSSLKKGKAKALIIDQSNANGPFSALKRGLDKCNPDSNSVSSEDVPCLEYVLPYNLLNGRKFLECLDDEDMIRESIDPNDVCVYMSTSGSEGEVKLMPFSSNVLLEMGNVAFAMNKDKMYMCDLDMGWISGFPHAYLAIGSTRVLIDRGSAVPEHSAELQWNVAVQEKCDICFTAPVYLLEFPEVRRNNKNAEMRNYKLKTIVAGGGCVTRNHVEAAVGEIADELMTFYGSTETGLSSSNKMCNADEYNDFSTGWPSVNTKFKVVDKDNKEVPADHYGEILIKTSQSLCYYINDLEKTSRTFGSDGWTRLGDIGKVDTQGQLYVMGRNKFAISKGNIVLYPEVIERYFQTCPGIKDVVIVGVPDVKLFEEICALFIKQPNSDISEKDVRTFCENIVIQDCPLIPKYIIFVESFPYTHRQKLNRKALKNMACNMLNL